MANSTKIAIVGLMILLVVVVAKYVKTGAPVNDGSMDGIATLNSGNSAVTGNREQQNPKLGLSAVKRRPMFPKLTASNGENLTPGPGSGAGPQAESAIGSEEAGAEIPAPAGSNSVSPPQSEPFRERVAQAGSTPVITESTGSDPVPGLSSITTANLPATKEVGDSPAVSKTPGGFPRKHTITTRDKGYWTLAEMYYGKGWLYPTISAVNKGIKFHPGNQVTIPRPPPGTKIAVKTQNLAAGKETKDPVANAAKMVSPAPKPAAPAVLKPPAPKGTPGFYTVKKGDTLNQIAFDQLGSTRHVGRLRTANKHLGLDFGDQLLSAGTRLRIPGI